LVSQVRRIQEVGPNDIKAAVDDFLADRWVDQTETLVYATSASVRRTEISEAAETEAMRLRKLGITFLPWDQEELSALLKDEPSIVSDFFGPEWRQAFCSYQGRKDRDVEPALARYRERVIALGTVIDLRPLGIDLRPIKVDAPATGLMASPSPADPKNPRSNDLKLVAAVRRRGRVVLLGMPGSGKSTALRQLAAYWAMRPEWPVPLVIPLRDVDVDRLGDFDSLVVELSLSVVDPVTKATLVPVFHEALLGGDALVLFDGLDETGTRRYLITQAIDRWLQQLDPAVEVVVSTRDSAFASAATLGLRHLRLEKPKDLGQMLQRLGAALAESGHVPSDQRGEWVRRRSQWVDEAVERGKLDSTPLLAVLLTVLAGQHELADLPSIVAKILSEIVDDAAMRLELAQRHRGQVIFEGLRPESSPQVLLESFALIGTCLIENGGAARVDRVDSRLADHLQEAWRLAPNVAASVAQTARGFWDEAGVFVELGRPGKVTAPTRLMAEIAAARWIAARPDAEQRSWTGERAISGEDEEVLLLACGLSRIAADELAAVAAWAESDDVAFRAVDAFRRGADMGLMRIEELAESLIRRTERPAGDRYRIALAITRLPVPQPLQDPALHVVAALDPNDQLILEAIAAGTWPMDRDIADRMLVGVLKAVPTHHGWFSAEEYGDALEFVARDMLPRDPAIAEALFEASGHSSTQIALRIRRRLINAGHGAIVERGHLREWKGIFASERWEKWGLAAADAWKAILHAIALLGTAEGLDRVQSRRLDDLADFLASLEYDRSPAQWVWWLPDSAAELEAVVGFAQRLGNFDPSVLAAEATLAAQIGEIDDVEPFLADAAVARSLDRWGESGLDEASLGMLVELLRAHPFVAAVASTLVLAYPEHVTALRLVEQVIPTVDGDLLEIAARLLLELDPSHLDRAVAWVVGDDPNLQTFGAQHVGRVVAQDSGKLDALDICLQSPSLVVRSQALRILGKPEEAGDLLLDRVLSFADGPTHWLCPHCGETNTSDQSHCASCSFVNNQWADWLKAARVRSSDAGPAKANTG
jgi:Predicted NTPase (NACHT family)